MSATPAVRGAGGRLYRVAGQALPSVTSVLGILEKSGLEKWKIKTALGAAKSRIIRKLAKPSSAPAGAPAGGWISAADVGSLVDSSYSYPYMVAGQAASFGTRCHAAIDKLVTGEAASVEELDTDDANILRVVDGFLEWQLSRGWSFHHAGDSHVFSIDHGYAGALDVIGRDADGNLCVVDFKVTNSISNDYAMQLAAYGHAFREMWQRRAALPELDDQSVPLDAAAMAAAEALVAGEAAPATEDGSLGDGVDAGAAEGGGAEEAEEAEAESEAAAAPQISAAAASTSWGAAAGHQAAPTSPTKAKKKPKPVTDLATLLRQSEVLHPAWQPADLDPLPGGVVVRFDRQTGAVEEHRVADMDVALEGFLAALKLWQMRNGRLAARFNVDIFRRPPKLERVAKVDKKRGRPSKQAVGADAGPIAGEEQRDGEEQAAAGEGEAAATSVADSDEGQQQGGADVAAAKPAEVTKTPNAAAAASDEAAAAAASDEAAAAAGATRTAGAPAELADK